MRQKKGEKKDNKKTIKTRQQKKGGNRCDEKTTKR